MDVKTIAIAILGGAFDSNELGDNDIACVPGALEVLQLQHVTGSDDVQLELVERSHVERLTAERDALQQLLNARDEEVDKLRAQLSDLAEAATSLIATVEVHKAKHEFQDDIYSHEKWAMDELNKLVSGTEANIKTSEQSAPATHKCRSCDDTGCPDCY